MISQLVDGKWVSLTTEQHAAQVLAEAAAAGIDLCPRCFYGNRVNGVCQMCARDAVFNADPDYRAWAEAHDRVDFGEWGPDSTRPYTRDDMKTDEATVARLSAKFNRAECAAKTDPDGCAVCGVSPRGHARRWHQGAGIETWVEPSISLRKARIVARRNIRLGRPAWAPLAMVASA